jgi:hypothetical protein
MGSTPPPPNASKKDLKTKKNKTMVPWPHPPLQKKSLKNNQIWDGGGGVGIFN